LFPLKTLNNSIKFPESITLIFGYDNVMEQPAWQKFLVLGFFLVLVVIGFIWLLYLRQNQFHHLTSPPIAEHQSQLSIADLDRQELQPKELPETINAQTDPDLFTALKTVRGEIIQLKGNFSLVIRPVKNQIMGQESVSIAIDKLNTITCWPKYYQADDGSRVALNEAYITIQKNRGEFYWANQKIWPIAKAIKQIMPGKHVLVKLNQDLTYSQLTAEQLVIIGCEW